MHIHSVLAKSVYGMTYTVSYHRYHPGSQSVPNTIMTLKKTLYPMCIENVSDVQGNLAKTEFGSNLTDTY